jgi:hypothetical protein
MRALLAVVFAAVALGLVPSGASAAGPSPSISLSAVTFTKSVFISDCAPVWHFTVEGVKKGEQAFGTDFDFNAGVTSLTHSDNGQSLVITQPAGAQTANDGSSHTFLMTVVNKTFSTIATSNSVTASSSC